MSVPNIEDIKAGQRWLVAIGPQQDCREQEVVVEFVDVHMRSIHCRNRDGIPMRVHVTKCKRRTDNEQEDPC